MGFQKKNIDKVRTSRKKLNNYEKFLASDIK